MHEMHESEMQAMIKQPPKTKEEKIAGIFTVDA